MGLLQQGEDNTYSVSFSSLSHQFFFSMPFVSSFHFIPFHFQQKKKVANVRDLELGSDAKSGASLLCDTNTLECPCEVSLEVQSPLVERAGCDSDEMSHGF
jgi:hypothetical protein